MLLGMPTSQKAASDLVSGVFGTTKWACPPRIHPVSTSYPPHIHLITTPRKTRHLAVGFYLLPAYSQPTDKLPPLLKICAQRAGKRYLP